MQFKGRAMFHKLAGGVFFCALATLMAVNAPVARAGTPDDDGIVWYTPVTSDDANAAVYEEGMAVATAHHTADDDSAAQSCDMADSPFMIAWLAAGPHAPVRERPPRVVIVIDDMGIDKKRSARIARLSSGLTLSFLPYAHDVQAQADAAAAMGHEVMMHVPMQPESMTVDPGPNVLRADIPAAELRARIAANLDAFHGYAGINNHMGSLFTQDRAGLEVLMDEVRRRGVFFLDSKTHPRSMAEQVAAEDGVLAAHRDVFLDHVETGQAVARALVQLERDARQHGVAIAIGHPKDVTIEGLAAWLPTLRAKGIDVIRLGDVLRERQRDALKMAGRAPGAPALPVVSAPPADDAGAGSRTP